MIRAARKCETLAGLGQSLIAQKIGARRHGGVSRPYKVLGCLARLKVLRSAAAKAAQRLDEVGLRMRLGCSPRRGFRPRRKSWKVKVWRPAAGMNRYL